MNKYTDEVDDEDFQELSADEQYEVMDDWFRSRYEDPAESTPYISAEGGYQWIWGRDDPRDVLTDRFEDIASQEVLDKLVADLHCEIGTDWVPINKEYEIFEEIEPIQEKDEPLSRLYFRVEKTKSILNLEGEADAKEVVYQLVYCRMITVFETFLWETVEYYFLADENVKRNVITKVETIKKRSLTLEKIFTRYDGLEKEIRGYFSTLVWHRWTEVRPLLKDGLGIDIDFSKLNFPLKKRHDVIHRSGQNSEREETIITSNDVKNLAELIIGLAKHIHDEIDRVKFPMI